MTQKDKELLLKDLCARLPYGVICKTEKGDEHLVSINQTIFGTEYGLNINPLKRDYFKDSDTEKQVIKPYLRPMSRMTEEEAIKYITLTHYNTDDNGKPYRELTVESLDWLLSNHLDFHGLIPMGLAIDATGLNIY